MTRNISVAAAKAHLSAVLAQVESGDLVVIERRGRPIAVIEPYRRQLVDRNQSWLQRHYGRLAGEKEFARLVGQAIRSRRTAGTRTVDLDEST